MVDGWYGMSDLYFNVRFGSYHYKFSPRGFKIQYNDYHSRSNRKSIENWRWFEIYEWFNN